MSQWRVIHVEANIESVSFKEQLHDVQLQSYFIRDINWVRRGSFPENDCCLVNFVQISLHNPIETFFHTLNFLSIKLLKQFA